MDAVPTDLTLSDVHEFLAQCRKKSLSKLFVSYSLVIEIVDKYANEVTTYAFISKLVIHLALVEVLLETT